MLATKRFSAVALLPPRLLRLFWKVVLPTTCLRWWWNVFESPWCRVWATQHCDSSLLTGMLSQMWAGAPRGLRVACRIFTEPASEVTHVPCCCTQRLSVPKCSRWRNWPCTPAGLPGCFPRIASPWCLPREAQSAHFVQEIGEQDVPGRPSSHWTYREEEFGGCMVLFGLRCVKNIPPTTENWLRKLKTYSKKNYKSTEDKHETNHINNKYNDTNTDTRKMHNT